MSGISQGRMSQELDYESEDEIGSLVENVRATCRQLNDIVQNLTYLMDEMARKLQCQVPRTPLSGRFQGNSYVYSSDEP